ncbi:MAG: peptidoglycan-binding protein [Actinomycetota bacterium]
MALALSGGVLGSAISSIALPTAAQAAPSGFTRTQTGISGGVTFTSSTNSSALVRTGILVRVGDRNTQVAAVQRALIGQGIAVRGGADGYFGPATLAAVKLFQERNGLASTGEVNATTAHLLGLTPAPNLPSRGQRGDLVRVLQQALVDAGISVRGGVDGLFGPATAAAVTAFQSSRSLAASGVVDMTTAIALGIVPGAPAASQPTSPAPATPAAPPAPAATPGSSISVSAQVVMATGHSGDSVRALQNSLIAAGVPVAGGADGKYGPATARAVAAYQTNMRLTPSGTVDTVTAQLLGLIAAPALPRIGSRGNEVASVQQLLINAGIPVRGGADGVFGPVTQSAISSFQQAQGLPVTGVLDLRTALFLGFVPGAAPPSAVPPSAPAPSPTPEPAPPAPPVITVFPVLGPCYFTDTWQAPRSGGRRHEGVDIIAKTGTPIYAVTNGTITRQFFDQPGSLGGNALRLTAPNGTYFHYAHLSTFAENIKVGSVVRAGEVIGFVGNTGNSSTPHLHFEYHPGGGAAVNPFPLVKAIDRCSITTPPEVAPA